MKRIRFLEHYVRGMNFSPVDLMKNEIFKVLADEHPVDAAKFK